MSHKGIDGAERDARMLMLLVVLAVSLPVGLCAADVAVPAGNGNVRIGGRQGELMQKAMRRRVFSEEARMTVYDEAENAFATHWDSSHCGWQNEYRGKTMLSVAGSDGRHDLDLPVGESVLTVAFDFSPRIIDSPAPEEDDVSRDAFYTVKRMTWYTPEMEGLVRRESAATVMRGPLVLAKGRAAGTSRMETLAFDSINWHGYRAEIHPARLHADNALCWGAWTLDLVRNGHRRSIPVADFWSVSSANDPENWFSLWF